MYCRQHHSRCTYYALEVEPRVTHCTTLSGPKPPLTYRHPSSPPAMAAQVAADADEAAAAVVPDAITATALLRGQRMRPNPSYISL